jgi:hypothetical protein
MSTKRVCDLKPGMEVRRPRAVSPDAWLVLDDPALVWHDSGAWVRLVYADGRKSNWMSPSYSVEVRHRPAQETDP